MELAQDNPAQGEPPVRKRRRRWLIVAFVLVLVSLGTWWYWPREGDARFVGKWKVTLQTQDGTLRAVSRVVVLHRNGTGETFDSTGMPDQSFAWIVQEDRYANGAPTANETVNAAVDRLRAWLPVSLQRIPSFTSESRIVSVSEQVVEMSTNDGVFTRIVMTRIPE